MIVLLGAATSGCVQEDRRLTPTAPATSTSAATLPQSYAWQVTLTGDVISATCEFDWSWQLADGSTVAGGSTDCVAPLTGTASIPLGATAIVVNGHLFDYAYPACSSDSKTVTKSLNGSENTSININLSVGGSYKAPDFFGNYFHIKCPSANAGFTSTLS
jgi:hypothetical protein